MKQQNIFFKDKRQAELFVAAAQHKLRERIIILPSARIHKDGHEEAGYIIVPRYRHAK